MSASVADLLKQKGPAVHTIDQQATVFEAIKEMVEKNVGSLVVMDGEKVAGIITERDYLRRIVLEGRTSRQTPVKEVMTTRLVEVDPAVEIEQCMSIMTRERIRHLPVIADGKLAGIISIGDVVKYLSRERAAEIRYLTDYISGKYPG
ncbi:MAG: CBS domain-containing protein [Acidobacteriota bacterium]|nr:MAG: CBS domain-containing protein [Acidobacteriota bacterium]